MLIYSFYFMALLDYRKFLFLHQLKIECREEEKNVIVKKNHCSLSLFHSNISFLSITEQLIVEVQ